MNYALIGKLQDYAHAHRRTEAGKLIAEVLTEIGLQRWTPPENKTAARDAALAEERRKRAEDHRLRALPALADRLAGLCFDEIDRQGRVLVRARLAQALLGQLVASGLHKRVSSLPPAPGAPGAPDAA
jgi:hypothetical protein